MRADNFFGTITLDAFSACVPVGHIAVGIERTDRVIDDCLHEEAVVVFQADAHTNCP